MSLFTPNKDQKNKISVKEIALFAMLGALVFGAQVAMEVFPNIHLTGMFIILFTRIFRKKALIPLYLYVFLIGIRWGFGLAWIPYLYIWLVPWIGSMLIPKKLDKRVAGALYCFVGAVSGITFGIVYAPAQAVLFGLSFKQTLLWISSGFLWDVVHAIGNTAFCTIVIPLSDVLEKAMKRAGI